MAAEVGPACTHVIAEFMEVNAIHRLRSAQGVLALRKTVGDVRLEAATIAAQHPMDPSTLKNSDATTPNTPNLWGLSM